MPFQCVVVTPEAQLLDLPITQAIVPAHDGLVGILTDRAPLLVKLGTGVLRIDLPNGQSRQFFLDGGVAQMKDNKLTILSTEAIAAENISGEAARAELDQATKLAGTDPKTAADREHRLARARTKMELAQKA